MARSATTSDVFNAVAEPQRRRILNLLQTGERSVGDIAELLGLKQPQASKHLGVLRQVGLVHVREVGQQRLYALNAQSLQPLHAWVSSFEHLWTQRLDRLETVLAELQQEPHEPEP